MYMNKIGYNYKDDQISLVDGMIDWVRIVDENHNILYSNKKIIDDLGEKFNQGKCYELLDTHTECSNCISCNTIRTGNVSEKEITIGGKTYNVVSSPIRNQNGEVVAAVEVFRDITYAKKLTLELNKSNIKMLEDINFAKNMQKRMLPPKEIYNGLLLDYLYEPSEMLSGDVFDVFKINNVKTGVYICDVVGHGVTASLLTMFVRQSLRTLSRNQHEINKIMEDLHKMFLSLNLDADKYFSLFFGIYDKHTKEFSYVNAGHNTNPIVLSNGSISFLSSKGYPICNLFDNVEYDISKIKLNMNDKIIFYTDGIVEAKNDKHAEFGEERLINIIKQDNDMLNQVYYQVKKFSSGMLKDDCAIMSIEVVD